MEQIIVNSKYKFINQIGEGGYGFVYLGQCLKNNQPVAIKVSANYQNMRYLKNEAHILRKLQSKSGFPKLHDYNKFQFGQYLVIELLDHSLRELQSQQKVLSLQQCLLIFKQAIQRLKSMHSLGILHMDIKPENIMIKKGCKQDRLYLIDFGISRSFLRRGNHVQQLSQPKIYGTLKFCSINAGRGMQQSRKDDLECLFYTIIHLLKGTLPWANSRDFEWVQHQKENTTMVLLCQNLHENFKVIGSYIKQLRFEQKPNYKYIHALIRAMQPNRRAKSINILKGSIQLQTRSASIKRRRSQKKKQQKENQEEDVTIKLIKVGPQISQDVFEELKKYK